CVVFKAHPLWIPGMVPFLIYLWIKKKSFLLFSGSVSGFAACFVAIFVLSGINPNIDYWHPHIFGIYPERVNGMRGYIEQMFSGTSTIFYLKDIGPFTNFSSVFLKYSLYALILIQVLRVIFRKHLVYSHLFFIGVLLTLCCLFIIDPSTFNPRHILAVAQLTCCTL